MKKRLSLLLVFAMIVSMIAATAVTVSAYAAEPRVGDTFTVEISDPNYGVQLGDSYAKGNVKNIEATSNKITILDKSTDSSSGKNKVVITCSANEVGEVSITYLFGGASNWISGNSKDLNVLPAKETTPITSVSATGMTLPTSLTLGQEFSEEEKASSLSTCSSTPDNSLGYYDQVLIVSVTDEEIAEYGYTPDNLIEWNGTKWMRVDEVGAVVQKLLKPIVGKRYAKAVRLEAKVGYKFTDTTTVNVNGAECSSANIIKFDDDELFAMYELGTLQSDGTFVAKKSADTKTTTTGANTGDSNDIALFGIMGILALAGAGFVYKRREN